MEEILHLNELYSTLENMLEEPSHDLTNKDLTNQGCKEDHLLKMNFSTNAKQVESNHKDDNLRIRTAKGKKQEIANSKASRQQAISLFLQNSPTLTLKPSTNTTDRGACLSY